MERQSRSNSFRNVQDIDVEKNTEPNAIGNDNNKRVGLSNLIKQYLKDYSLNSNLHGLKYIGEKERTTVEKIFWFFVFICCILLCSGLIQKLWIKWNDNPVIVSFSETYTPVWQIPYPAITLCPDWKVMQTVFNYTKYYHLQRTKSTTSEEVRLFEDITLICNENVATWLEGRNFTLGNKTVENIKKVSPTIYDIMERLTWNGIRLHFSSFTRILTEEGYCYTFNTIDANQLLRIENLNTDYNYLKYSRKSQTWTLENGYPPKTPFETYPHRGTGYGENTGLNVILTATIKYLDYLCSGPTQGFKILLHNPAEFPRISHQYFRVPLGQNVAVAVKPKMITTSDGLKPYNPIRSENAGMTYKLTIRTAEILNSFDGNNNIEVIRRQCYFSSERYLRFFKVYTQVNCETECLTNFTYARCGCVHFGLPHGPEMQVCSVGKRRCMNKVRMELVTIEVQSNLEEAANTDDSMGEARRLATKCKCLPGCTSIEYEAEISQSDYNVEKHLNALFNSSRTGQSQYLYTKTKIFFKEAQFINMRRSELYGQIDFLANCGGLLGLFLGFSILSIVEIIYFFTLRLLQLLHIKHLHLSFD